jgi:DNA replication protein DnaC
MSDPCPTCRGTGFTIRDDARGVVVAVRCECSVEERSRRILSGANIPRRYEHCSLDQFDMWQPDLAHPLAVAKDWLERWPVVDMGLLFIGSPGTGKTHLSVGILRALAVRKGAKVMFAEQRELLKELQATFDGAGGRTEADVLAPVLEAEVLLLDDLGAGRTTAWAQDVMHDVLAHRYNRKLPTIMTSNRPTGDDEDSGPTVKDVPTLKDRLGEALMSRIYEMSLVVPVTCEDYRRRVLHARHRF